MVLLDEHMRAIKSPWLYRCPASPQRAWSRYSAGPSAVAMSRALWQTRVTSWVGPRVLKIAALAEISSLTSISPPAKTVPPIRLSDCCTCRQYSGWSESANHSGHDEATRVIASETSPTG